MMNWLSSDEDLIRYGPRIRGPAAALSSGRCDDLPSSVIGLPMIVVAAGLMVCGAPIKLRLLTAVIVLAALGGGVSGRTKQKRPKRRSRRKTRLPKILTIPEDQSRSSTEKAAARPHVVQKSDAGNGISWLPSRWCGSDSGRLGGVDAVVAHLDA